MKKCVVAVLIVTTFSRLWRPLFNLVLPIWCASHCLPWPCVFQTDLLCSYPERVV